VALGPLTNLALALRADAALASRIEMIYISGGAINVPGMIHADVPANPNRVAEWNLYLDPEAADQVFKTGIRIALIPMDVTHVNGARRCCSLEILFGAFEFLRVGAPPG